jgi:hypothetical protein
MKLAATGPDGKTKWPLPCGCKSNHYYAMCDDHIREYHEDAARRMGVPDLQVITESAVISEAAWRQLRIDVEVNLALRPTKPLVVRFLRGRS